MDAMRVKKKFQVANINNPHESIEVDFEFDAVIPGPTNHALQVWPLVYEWRNLPPGVHRDIVSNRLANAAFSLAAGLDRANQVLSDPQVPRLTKAVESYALHYAQSVSNYQNAHDDGVRKAALDFLLKFGLAACQAIDQFNTDHAKQGQADAANP